MAPRSDGTPTIQEMLAEDLIEAAGLNINAAEFLAGLRQSLNRDPEFEDMEAALGLDPRRHKPWPIEDDCPGCDQRKEGPHRFGCTLHGKRQLVIPGIKK